MEKGGGGVMRETQAAGPLLSHPSVGLTQLSTAL